MTRPKSKRPRRKRSVRLSRPPHVTLFELFDPANKGQFDELPAEEQLKWRRSAAGLMRVCANICYRADKGGWSAAVAGTEIIGLAETDLLGIVDEEPPSKEPDKLERWIEEIAPAPAVENNAKRALVKGKHALPPAERKFADILDILSAAIVSAKDALIK